MKTREEIVAAAKVEHDKTCMCDPRYLMSCPNMANAILAQGDKPPQHSWMQTFTGKAFDPLSPEVDKIDIKDIAHALSLVCRYGGHVHRFYSVAEHSVLVSRHVSPQHALWGLLHDASEAYICDMVRPVKKRMPEYQLIENNLMAHILHKFRLPAEQPAEVADVDLRIVIDEKAALLGPEPHPWGALAGLDRVWATVEGWNPAKAEELFLERFFELWSSWT